jgi:two-component system cell cycle response regulator
MVVVNGATALAEVTALAERLRSEIANAPVDLNETLFVTASFGVALATREETVAQVTKRADDALYQAKHDGRNRVVGAA